MKSKIKKVAVLGSGVMGAQIAGHLANAVYPLFYSILKNQMLKTAKNH